MLRKTYGFHRLMNIRHLAKDLRLKDAEVAFMLQGR